MAGENCSASCTTRDHDSYGDCLRAKGLRVGYCNSASGRDRTAQKKWDAELGLYKSARDQGIQPATTQTRDIRAALDISDRTGTAYQAG